MNRREAEENLEDAINNLLEVYGHNEGLLVDWFLVTAHHHEEDDGTATSNGVYGPSHQRVYSAAGLIKYAQLKIEDKFRGN